MATSYVDRAVRGLNDYITPAVIGGGTAFEFYLREYETAAGLAVLTLPNPVAYARAYLPHDTRSPLSQVYESSFAPVDNRNRLTTIDLNWALEYTHHADTDGGEDIMRGYISAMINTLEADSTLGARVNAAWWTDGDRTHPMFGQDSTIRHVRVLGVTVHVHDG